MKPKILLINGSPRKKGETAKRLKEVEKWIKKEGGESQFLHLIDFKILPCLGCYSQNPKLCTFPCKVKDDMEKIYPLLLKCDGMVLGAPSYWFLPPGIVKNFVDRLTCLENNGFLLEGKIFGTVSVAEESGGEEVGQSLIAIFNAMGCLIPPFATPFFNKEGKGSCTKEDLRELGQNIVRLAKVLKGFKFG